MMSTTIPNPYEFKGEWSGKWEQWDDPAKGESRGGLVIRNLHNHYFQLAKDIRVIGIWVFPKDKESYSPKFMLLGPPDFERVGSGTPVVSGTIERSKDRFQDYNTIQELRMDFKSVEPLFEEDGGYLYVTIKYLMTDYGTTPPHEPSTLVPGAGGLPAARFFPIVEFRYENDNRLASLRVDYRFNPSLQGTLEPDYKLRLNTYPNQMGIFKDADNIASAAISPVVQAAKELYEGGDDMYFAQGVLEAMEKPCIYEAAFFGLWKGESKTSVKQIMGSNGNVEYFPVNENELNKTEVRGWDNMHWWGSTGTGNPIISAIGAFHALHMHWRWGVGAQVLIQPFSLTEYEIIYDPFQEQDLRTMEGFKRLAGKKLSELWNKKFDKIFDFSDLKGLVDPSVPIQTHRMVVTKNAPDLDPSAYGDTDYVVTSLRSLSTENFYDRFIKDSKGDFTVPKEINVKDETKGYEGTDIVLWYSIEADVSDKSGDEIYGALFTNGLYFAHDPEPEFIDPTLDVEVLPVPTPPFLIPYVEVDVVKQTSLLRGSREVEYDPWGETKVRQNKKWFRSPDLYK